jgi:hypothetical protein
VLSSLLLLCFRRLGDRRRYSLRRRPLNSDYLCICICCTPLIEKSTSWREYVHRSTSGGLHRWRPPPIERMWMYHFIGSLNFPHKIQKVDQIWFLNSLIRVLYNITRYSPINTAIQSPPAPDELAERELAQLVASKSSSQPLDKGKGLDWHDKSGENFCTIQYEVKESST